MTHFKHISFSFLFTNVLIWPFNQPFLKCSSLLGDGMHYPTGKGSSRAPELGQPRKSREPCFPTYKQLFINKWHTIHTKVNIKVKNKEDLNNAVQRSVGPRNVNELTRKAVCSDLPHTPQQLKSVSFTLTELCKEGGWNAS